MRTPPRPAEFLDTLPELAVYGRSATRLHPRPGVVTAFDSHVGGPLRWPADEPWPTCERKVLVSEEVPLPADLVTRMQHAKARRVQQHVLADGEFEVLEEIAAFVGPGYWGMRWTDDGPVVGCRSVEEPHPVPHKLIAVAQLRASDIPDLPRPHGADLLQILWCPLEHVGWAPVVELRWRREADVVEPFLDQPDGPVPGEDGVPEPCRLHPEQVVDYPYHEELPVDLQERLAAWDGRGEHYLPGRYLDLAMAPGWKVGGYAGWNVTDLQDTPCPRCAGSTRLLFVADSCEYDGGTGQYWQPLDDPDPQHADEPTGVSVGRHGALRIFACPTCPGTPFVTDVQ